MYRESKIALEVIDLFSFSERFILPVRLDGCEICERKLKEHHWVDLFAEREYQNELRKILQVVSPGTFLLRSKRMELSAVDVNEMIKKHSYYDRDRNPESKRINYKDKL